MTLIGADHFALAGEATTAEGKTCAAGKNLTLLTMFTTIFLGKISAIWQYFEYF